MFRPRNLLFFFVVLPSLTELYLVLSSFTELYWVSLGFTEFLRPVVALGGHLLCTSEPFAIAHPHRLGSRLAVAILTAAGGVFLLLLLLLLPPPPPPPLHLLPFRPPFNLISAVVQSTERSSIKSGKNSKRKLQNTIAVIPSMSSRYGDEKYKKKIRKKFSSFLELSLTRSADGDSSEFTVECRMFCPHLFFSLVVAVVCCCCWIFLNVFLVDFDFCFFLVALETPTRVSLPNPIKRKTWQKK